MKFWLGCALVIFGLICIVIAIVWQQVLCFQKFGVIFDEIFIPHWSAFFYLGVIPGAIGYFIAKE